MAVSPAELTLLISAGASAIGLTVRSFLLVVEGLTSIYAKAPTRRAAAAKLTGFS